jgi:hypothetical protein
MVGRSTVRLVHGGVPYGEYVREEQRSQPWGPQRAFPSALGWERGCSAGRTGSPARPPRWGPPKQPDIHRGLLGRPVAVSTFETATGRS